jgi:hypothetical protein
LGLGRQNGLCSGVPWTRSFVVRGIAPSGLKGRSVLQAGSGRWAPVAGVAAALQSLAKPGFSQVGPATRAATEGVFEWGPTQGVVIARDTKPFVATYLDRPRSGAPGRRWR